MEFAYKWDNELRVLKIFLSTCLTLQNRLRPIQNIDKTSTTQWFCLRMSSVASIRLEGRTQERILRGLSKRVLV